MAFGLWVLPETAPPPLRKGDLTARMLFYDVKGPFRSGRVPFLLKVPNSSCQSAEAGCCQWPRDHELTE